jgi:hypothetical protein
MDGSRPPEEVEEEQFVRETPRPLGQPQFAQTEADMAANQA